MKGKYFYRLNSDVKWKPMVKAIAKKSLTGLSFELGVKSEQDDDYIYRFAYSMSPPKEYFWYPGSLEYSACSGYTLGDICKLNHKGKCPKDYKGTSKEIIL